MSDKIPDFFIVGGQKCGTTSMYQYLNQHPDIFMPSRKEPNFFNTDMYAPHFTRDREVYQSLFSKAKNEKKLGEATPLYLYSKNAAEEIKRFNETAQIIIMLRNPVDVMYSLHSQQLYNGRENLTDFQDALNAEAARKQGLVNLPKGYTLIEGLFYRETVSFAQQVQRYQTVFGKEKVHIIIFDDFKHDTVKSVQDTLRFLDVDQNFQADFGASNSNKRVRNLFLKRLLMQLPRVARKLGRPPARSNFWRKTFRRLTSFNTVEEARPSIDPELKRCLQVEFTPEIENLSQLVGRDLTHWSKV